MTSHRSKFIEIKLLLGQNDANSTVFYSVNMKNVVNLFCLAEFRLLLLAIFTGKSAFHIFQLHHIEKLV